MKTRLTIVTVLALLALAATAIAQGPHGPRSRSAIAPEAPACGPQFDRVDRLDFLVDLTEEQEAAIEAIRDQAREQGVELRKQEARLQNEIEGELLADDPSEKTLVALTEKLGAVRTDLQVVRVKTRLAVRAELTEEQRDTLMLMADRGGRRGLHRHHEFRDRRDIHRFFRHGFPKAHDEDEDKDDI